MRSPSTAMLWERYASFRWWLIVGAAYFALVAAVCHLLPQGPTYLALRAYLIAPLATSPLVLIAIFVCSAYDDLCSSDSLFPKRMFHLPLSTRTLAGTPMLVGVSIMFLLCISLIAFTLRSVQPDFPLLWPPLLAAACLAWLQALAWMPFGIPFLRVAFGMPLIGCVLALPGLAHFLGLPSPVLVATLALQIPLAYALAEWGLARARRGDTPQWDWLVDWIRRLCRRNTVTHAFPSPSRAQQWLEWRRNGLGLTLAALLTIPFLIIFSFLTPTRSDVPTLLFWIFSPLSILFVPLMAAMSTGAEFGVFRASPEDSSPPAFLATRPMSSTSFVLAKLATGLRAVVVCYAVAIPAFLLVTLLTGRHQMMIETLLDLCAGSALRAIGITLLVLLALPALTWKFTVENMFVGLCGRKWITTIAIPTLAFAFWLLPALAWWIFKHPELVRLLIKAAPYALFLLVGLKLLLSRKVYLALKTRQLIEPALARQAITIWLTAVLLLAGLAIWLIPSNILPWHTAACAAVLLVPIARIGLAPLAVNWNRHR